MIRTTRDKFDTQYQELKLRITGTELIENAEWNGNGQYNQEKKRNQ